MPKAEANKYIVPLNADEREKLESLIHKGKHPATRVLKARILLKADVSDAREGWSGGRIVHALDTSRSTVFRARRQLVEEGFDAVLTRKHSPNSALRRIFDGGAEAKLIAPTCSPPPNGWTLKKHSQTASEGTMGHSTRRERRVRGRDGRCAGGVSPAA